MPAVIFFVFYHDKTFFQHITMHFTGQPSAQAPQPVHFSRSTHARKFFTSIAPAGQVRAHFPQPIQPAVQFL